MTLITASKSLLLIFLIFFLSGIGVAIDCYQCSSIDTNNAYQCAEFMTGYENIKPKPCNNTHDAKYCIKFTGRQEDGLKTERYCSTSDLGNYCNYGRQVGDSLDYRSCFYTCSTDGCNTATRGAPSLIQIAAFIGMFLKTFI